MPELTPEEAENTLFAPHTIYAPDGTTFVMRVESDPNTPEQVFDSGFISFEVVGPGDRSHRWLAGPQGDFVQDPGDDDVPRLWTVKAQLALSGWLELDAAAAAQ